MKNLKNPEKSKKILKNSKIQKILNILKNPKDPEKSKKSWKNQKFKKKINKSKKFCQQIQHMSSSSSSSSSSPSKKFWKSNAHAHTLKNVTDGQTDKAFLGVGYSRVQPHPQLEFLPSRRTRVARVTVDNRRPSFFISVALKMPASGWKTASAMRTSGAQSSTSTNLKSLEIKSVTLRRVRHCLLNALSVVSVVWGVSWVSWASGVSGVSGV